MKFPNFGGRWNGRKVLRALIVTTALTTIFYPEIKGAIDPESPEWPATVASTAEVIPFSEMRDLIIKTEDGAGAGRRVAVYGGSMIMEMKSGAGDAAPAEGVETAPDIFKAEVPSENAYSLERLAQSDAMAEAGFELDFFAPPKVIGLDDILSIMFQFAMIGMLGFFAYSMLSRFRGGSKSVEMIDCKNLKVGLDDVAGLGNMKSEIEEVIALLKPGSDLEKAGGRMPKGVVMTGPPGTGKTLTARAMAKEAGVNFLNVNAASLQTMFVGTGPAAVAQVFSTARKNAPCIIFFDEIDSIGRKRGGGHGTGADDERDKTLNALLTELDGFDARSGIFVVAATNRMEILDPALTRPGRIDRKIVLQLPDIAARREILDVHLKEKSVAQGVNLDAVAATLYGASGADIANMVNEAALNAARNDRAELSQEDFDHARDRMIMPSSGGNLTLAQDEREITAYHEAGHAVEAILCENADPVEKVTIAPRGQALGFVLQRPDRDRVFESESRLKSRIRVAMAGRAAEAMIFGEGNITTGAASDIQQATAVAKAMVTDYGMSRLGFQRINLNEPYGAYLAEQVHEVVSDILRDAEDEVRQSLAENEAAVRALGKALLEHETLTGEQARIIVEAHIARPAAEEKDEAEVVMA